MLDFSGLVNGRTMAVMPIAERTARIAAERPDFLFLSRRQAGSLQGALDLSAYTVCKRFRISSLSAAEPYVLAVRDTTLARSGVPCNEPLCGWRRRWNGDPRASRNPAVPAALLPGDLPRRLGLLCSSTSTRQQREATAS